MSSFFTLGHSNHSIETWLALVRRHEIEVVVDTRSSPYSKYVPQFDRELIQRSLEEAGIRYLFLGAELGGRPANPAYYDASGRVLYSRLRDDPLFQAAIARLESGMERFRVALLCGEEDPAHCHRRRLHAVDCSWHRSPDRLLRQLSDRALLGRSDVCVARHGFRERHCRVPLAILAA